MNRLLVDYPDIGLTRSRDPNGVVLNGYSCEFHGWDGEHYRFPRFQQSDGQFLFPLLSEMTHWASKRSPAIVESGLLAIHFPDSGQLEYVAARLGYIDLENGEIKPLYPDVVIDDHRRFRIRRAISDAVFSIEAAAVLLRFFRGEDVYLAGATPRWLGAQLFKRYHRRELRQSDGRWREPSDAESDPWGPLAIAALEEFWRNLELARASGFSHGVLLSRELKGTADVPSAKSSKELGDGYAIGGLLHGFDRIISRILRW